MSTSRPDLALLRKEYTKSGLLEEDAGADPIQLFQKWFNQAVAAEALEPNAMTLATVGADGAPSARIVLLKSFDDQGFGFFTNFGSRKSRELSAGSPAALVFFWAELERQIRATGQAAPVAHAESQRYFHSRPRGSQLSAWASRQSSILPARATLDAAYAEMEEKFAGREIPLPPFWGGFRLRPQAIEFWQGRPSRLHDRLLFTLVGAEWRRERLAP